MTGWKAGIMRMAMLWGWSAGVLAERRCEVGWK